MCDAYSEGKELACAVHRALDCTTVMSDVRMWYVLLHGRSFRGIISDAAYVLPLIHGD